MAELTVIYRGVTKTHAIKTPVRLSDALNQLGYTAPHPCGGRGTCFKCRVRIAGAVSDPSIQEQQAGLRLSCQTMLQGDAAVWLEDQHEMAQIELSGSVQASALKPMKGRYGAAIDIGTTTLALKLFDLTSGCCIGQTGNENPQRTVASDVMGRIQASLDGKGNLMQGQVVSALTALLEEACQQHHIAPALVDVMVIVGNTTMLYLLTGKNPQSLAFAPFEADDLFGRSDLCLGRQTYLPPCMNAFVGADITAAVLASGMCDKDEVSLLCDIGTNGELALWKDGTLYVTSTAAGPAFEGAGISCGCGSIPGAIDRVWVEEAMMQMHTIGDLPPVGVCGSGLLDAIAAYLELNEIDETGATEQDELSLGEGVKLLPKDIRAVQLAKAAIASGIKTLLHEAGVAADDVHTLYIAGGFGSHLNIESAVRIGLIPKSLRHKAVVIGNAALSGAASMLLNTEHQVKAAAIAGMSRHVNLGGNKVFGDLFIENMMFG